MKQDGSRYDRMRANRMEEEDNVAPITVGVNKLQVHDGKFFTQQDMLVPWDSEEKTAEKQVLRYYHLFVEGEMERLVAQVENCRVIRSFYEQGNWFVEIERL